MRLATLHFSGAFLCHVTRWISQTFPCTLEFTLSLVNSRYVASILFLRYAKYTTLSLVNSRALSPCHSRRRRIRTLLGTASGVRSLCRIARVRLWAPAEDLLKCILRAPVLRTTLSSFRS